MPDPRLIMAVHIDERGEVEAEPVTVEVGDGRVVFGLDDGRVFSFDEGELAAVLEDVA